MILGSEAKLQQTAVGLGWSGETWGHARAVYRLNHRRGDRLTARGVNLGILPDHIGGLIGGQLDERQVWFFCDGECYGSMPEPVNHVELAVQPHLADSMFKPRVKVRFYQDAPWTGGVLPDR